MGVHLGRIELDPSIVAKVNAKHQCTPDKIREALQWPARAEVAWESHPEHGRRLIAVGTTATATNSSPG